MKKKDLLLVSGILCIALIGLLAVRFLNRAPGAVLNVMVDGKLYESYSLEENQTVTLDISGGQNVFEIKDGTVNMILADCPDQYCVKHAPITNENETIVCLPHKVVLEISGTGTKKEIDA